MPAIQAEKYNQIYFTELLFNKISSNKSRLADAWKNPEKTSIRHFLLDDLLPDDACLAIYKAFPKDTDGQFSAAGFSDARRSIVHLSGYEAVLANAINAFQDPKIVALVSEICGLKDIQPDPTPIADRLLMMFRNDALVPHLDTIYKEQRQQYRRLNVLYYVSPNWQSEYGGDLVFLNANKAATKAVGPVANRLLVMEINQSAWHLVSTVHADAPRCSLTNYYFSKSPPARTTGKFKDVWNALGRVVKGLTPQS